MSHADFARAQALVDLGRPADAIPHLLRCIGDDPHDPRPRRMLARAHLALGQPNEALSAAHGAVAASPEDPYSLTTLSTVLVGVGRNGEALAIAERAAVIAPSNVDVLLAIVNAGLACGAAGRAAATRAARQALAAHPDSASTRNAMGRLAFVAQRWEEAERWFRAALEITPEDVAVRRNLALALTRRRRHHEVVDVLEGNLRIDPGDTRSASSLVAAAHLYLAPAGVAGAAFAAGIGVYLAGTVSPWFLLPAGLAFGVATAAGWRRHRRLSAGTKALARAAPRRAGSGAAGIRRRLPRLPLALRPIALVLLFALFGLGAAAVVGSSGSPDQRQATVTRTSILALPDGRKIVVPEITTRPAESDEGDGPIETALGLAIVTGTVVVVVRRRRRA